MLILASTSWAASIDSVTFDSEDFVVSKPAVFDVSFSYDAKVDGSGYVSVVWALNPGNIACAAKDANAYARLEYGRTYKSVTSPQTTVRFSWTPAAAVTYNLCLYLGNTSASSSRQLTVRQPKTSLNLLMSKKRLTPAETAIFTVRFQSEVPRSLHVYINNEQVPCGANIALNQPYDKNPTSSSISNGWFSKKGIVGQGEMVSNIVVPSLPGFYHLCSYIDATTSTYIPSHVDATPTTVLDSTPFSVGPKPQCTMLYKNARQQYVKLTRRQYKRVTSQTQLKIQCVAIIKKATVKVNYVSKGKKKKTVEKVFNINQKTWSMKIKGKQLLSSGSTLKDIKVKGN